MGIGTVHLPLRTLAEWQTLPLPRPCSQCEGDGKIGCPECHSTGGIEHKREGKKGDREREAFEYGIPEALNCMILVHYSSSSLRI